MPYTSSYTGPQIDEKLGLAHKQGQVAAGSGITVTKSTTEGVVTSTVAIDATTIPTKTEVTAEIADVVSALDVASVGGDAKYISAISETNGKISATAKDFPTIPSKVSDLTNDSAFQTQTQVSTAITTEINKLDVTDTAVSGKYVSAVSETDGKISVTRANLPTVPTKTSDLTNDSGFITSADVPTKVSELTNDAGYLTEHQSLANYTTKTYVDTEVGKKQDKLTAGTNITISTDGKTISATDTTYTAGAGISITGNVISSVASAPQFSEILGDPTDNTKLATALNSKADASDVYTKTESDAKFRTESQVSTAISTEIGKLDKADTAVAGKYVSAVSEVDGVITVTRADLPSSVDAYTKSETDAKIATEIQKLDKADTAVNGKYVSQVSETDGVITVTRADLPVYTGDGKGTGGADAAITVDSTNHITLTDEFTGFLGGIAETIEDLPTTYVKKDVYDDFSEWTSEKIDTIENSVAYPEDIKDYIKAGDGIRLSTPTGTNDVYVHGYTVTPAGGSDIQVNYNTSRQEIQISATSFPEVHRDYTDLLTIEHKTGSSTTPVISAPGLATKAEVAAKQDALVAGSGISIAADGKTISATGSHTHDNKSELDLITTGDVNKWNATTSEVIGIEEDVLPICVKTCAPTATAESQVLKIVRVTELPADPDPTTLYVVIE